MRIKKIKFFKENYRYKGVASLLIVVAISSIIFLVSFSSAIISFWQLMKSKNNLNSLYTYYLAYSGVQDALLKLERNINFNGSYNLSILKDNDVSISVLNNGETATITSLSSYLNNFKKIEAIVSIDQETGKVTVEKLEEKTY